MADRNRPRRRRICARCGAPARSGHRCLTYAPACAAAALDDALPDKATLGDVTEMLSGSPAEIATAAAHLPQRRRDAIWQRLADERERAHREAA